MLKKTAFILLLVFCTVIQAENLLPDTTLIGKGNWESARNAAAQAIFSTEKIDETHNALKIEIKSDSGYAYYRVERALAPGEYTFYVNVKGKTDDGLSAEIYSFDAAKKPRLIALRKTKIGAIEDDIISFHVTVPENSVNCRIGVGFSKAGVGVFSTPTLLKGKEKLPAAQKKTEFSDPVTQKWIARWIYIQDDRNTPRVIYSKKLELSGEPLSAFVQITADNGYTLSVNKQIIGSDVDWKNVEKYDIAQYLKKGENLIEIDGMNFDGPGGVVLQGAIIDVTGKLTPLITDGSWQATTIDGKSLAIKDLGQVPTPPWNVLPFQQINPAKQIDLTLLSLNSQVKPGEILKWEFSSDHEITPDKLKQLQIKFFDENRVEIPLSAFEPIVRQELKIKKLFVELPLSEYAQPGRYTASIEGDTWKIVPSKNPEISVESIKSPTPASNIQYPHPADKTHNQMTINGQNQSRFVYATEIPNLQSFLNWRTVKGNVYELSIPTGQWRSNGKYAISDVEKQMLQILEADKNAAIYLKFRIDIPGFWAAKYPDDIFISNKGRSALQSFCSENWRRDAISAVIDAVKDLQKRPAGKHLAGVLLMGFRGGEFQLWGEDVAEYDCSKVAKEEFSAYQKKNQISPLITLPNAALEFPFNDNTPEAQKIRKTYFTFVAARHAENMIYFAKEFKKVFGDSVGFGIYFGYGSEHSSSISRMLFGGHLGVAKVIDEAPLDLISCPFSYSLRRKNQSHAFMNPIDSAILHNITPIGENDIRNYRTEYFGDSSGTTVFTLSDSVINDKRMRLMAATHGAIVRYLAILSTVDFFSDPAIQREIAKDNQLIMELEEQKIGDANQVVLACDFLSWAGGSAIPQKQFTAFASEIRDTLRRTGRGVKFLTMNDYLKNLSAFKYAVIPFPALLDAETLKKIAAKWGKLPDFDKNTGAIVLSDGKTFAVESDLKEVWNILSTNEAKKATFNTVWYIGNNFKAAWDGQNLTMEKIQ